MPIGGCENTTRRNHVVAQVPVRHAAEHAVREPPAGRDRDGRELGLARDVADGVDAGRARVLVAVDDDEALGVELDAGALEADVRDVRRAADGPEHRVEAVERAAVGGIERRARSPLRARARACSLRHDLDAARAHRGHELLAEQRVEVPQHASCRINSVTSLPSARSTPASSTAM